ncbi:RICIN domain-containing protein [Paenibacillus sp. UMB7766-LJ446]|uniref:RICIN domain-containing protein n=1 Tax=Paenibacillus sp. UMB7766-LJ446 TaxID=3046313 RepID=UPI00254BAB6C|nr:RICIN domain-containing protein [Paenibacillus sp. UMB7766-LJ446]MDK8191926.1 RICIN domain-containing protein [Paenibacillus sp. UMB7766-LJ446]
MKWLKRMAALLMTGSLLTGSLGLGTEASAAGSYTATADPSKQYQTIEGWGTSLAWWGKVVGEYSNRDEYAEKMFSPTNGLGLNVLRYNIGGGDNPISNVLEYRKAVPGYQPSPGVYDWNADANQRYMLQAAKSYGVNVVEAFANSAPYWMTISGSVSGAANGGNNLKPDYYDDFADYLTEVVKHFRDNWGITFDTVTPLNEPISTWWKLGNNQEGMHFDRADQNKILSQVQSSLTAKGLSTKLSAPEEYSLDDTTTSFNSYSSAVKSAISQINTHTYGGSNRATLRNTATSAGKHLWTSEYGDGDASGLTMSRTILKDIRNMGASAWVYWQAVDSADGWGFFKNVLNNTQTTSYTVNQKYYVMGNYSKFIRPGTKIIGMSDANTLAAYDAASGKVVLVTTNSDSSDTAVTYDLSQFTSVGSSAQVYRTSSTEKLQQLTNINIQNKKFTVTAKAGSVTTYVISGATYNGGTGYESGAIYKLINRNSSLALDVNGASTAGGATIIQWNDNGAANQQWKLESAGNRYYKIRNVGSGLLLDVNQSSTQGGAALIQWQDNGGNNQQWLPVDVGGYLVLVNRNSGLTVDINQSSTTAGALTIQWADNGGANQQWSLVKVN